MKRVNRDVNSVALDYELDFPCGSRAASDRRRIVERAV